MMKKLLLLTAVFLAALSVSAQRTISGQVIDSEEKEAVIQATVALLKTDSSMVSNAVTNVSGQFKMTAPSDGNFLVRVTYVGYKPLFRRVAVSDGKPVALGSLTISPDTSPSIQQTETDSFCSRPTAIRRWLKSPQRLKSSITVPLCSGCGQRGFFSGCTGGTSVKI
jgi:hypothetical protein